MSEAAEAAAVAAAYEEAQRVVALIDMDHFEVQVWSKAFPRSGGIRGKPVVVADDTGRIVSATQEAKKVGISRSLRLPAAKKLAHEHKIHLEVIRKPTEREKPVATAVRFATWDIIDALEEYRNTFTYNVILECASNDEFYLDITDEVNLRMNSRDFPIVVGSKTFLEAAEGQIHGDELESRVYEYPLRQDLLIEEEKLIHGALLMQEVNSFLYKKTQYTASVGIGSNKLLAKLAVSLNKPNGITILPDAGLSRLGKEMDLSSISGLGGKFGSRLKEMFQISTVSEFCELEFDDLEQRFSDAQDKERALEAYMKCRGVDDDRVIEKLKNDSVSCGKKFNNGEITSDETLKFRLFRLFEELLDRLEEEEMRHKRTPSYVKANFTYEYKQKADVETENSQTPSVTYHVRDPELRNPDQLSDEAVRNFLRISKLEVTAINVTHLCVMAKFNKAGNYN